VPCRNPGAPLRDALESVWRQREVAVELIVVDGSSTDGTSEWLEQHRSQIAVQISEPDGGIYDAMNKGVARAHGARVLFLGADDALASDLAIAEALHATPQAADVAGGSATYTDGRIYRFSANASRIARNFVHHQCALYRRELFDRFGAFDTAFRIAADYDFNLRLARGGALFAEIPTQIARCGIRGLSDSGTWPTYGEEIAVRHRHFPVWRSLPWDALSVVRFIRKQAVARRS
jgi:glycosyltransferase